MEEGAADDNRMATYRLHLPRNPKESDRLFLEVSFRGVVLTAKWNDGRSQDLVDVLQPKGIGPILQACHIHYQTQLISDDMDADLDELLGDS